MNEDLGTTQWVPSERSPSTGTSWAVVKVLGVGFVAFLAALVLTSVVITTAYSFAPDSGIGSLDDLYRLGTGPRDAFTGIWVPLAISAGVAFALLLSPAYHWAWTAPAASVLVSIALCVVFVNTFQIPIPLIGG